MCSGHAIDSIRLTVVDFSGRRLAFLDWTHGGVERTRRAGYRKGLGGTGAACVLHVSLPNAGWLVIPQNGGIAPVPWLHTKTLELQQATKRKHAMLCS